MKEEKFNYKNNITYEIFMKLNKDFYRHSNIVNKVDFLTMLDKFSSNRKVGCQTLMPHELKFRKEPFLQNKDKIKNIYEFLYSRELLILAKSIIFRDKGGVTKAVSAETLNVISYTHIYSLRKLFINKKFSWRSLRKVEIFTKDKKPRTLVINDYTDNLIQYVCNLVLNAIYDPLFEKYNYNYGLRPKYSVHSNILDITDFKNQGLNMSIKGNISGAFDNINYNKLIGILKHSIADKDFINIIKTACQAEIIPFNKLWHVKSSTTPALGTQEAFIMSPILFNIYMHDFDMHITTYLTNKLDETNKIRNNLFKLNVFYKFFDLKIGNLKKKVKKLKDENIHIKLSFEETRKLKTQIRIVLYYKKLRIKNSLRNAQNIKLIWKYSRYANEFIVLTNCNIQICQEIREECNTYLLKRLHLTLNEEKTIITNLKDKPVTFLGFSIYVSKFIPKKTETSIKVRQRIFTHIKIGIDLDRTYNQLVENKYAKEKHDGKLFPSHTPYLTSYSILSIVEHYNQLMEGICNYYFRVITNPSQLKHILYLLYYSCIFTIASKIKSSTSKIFRKYLWDEYDIQNNPTGYKKLVFQEVLDISRKFSNRTIKYVCLQTYQDCLAKSLRVAYNIDFKKSDPHLVVNENYWRYKKVNSRISILIPKICIICHSARLYSISNFSIPKKRELKRDNFLKNTKKGQVLRFMYRFLPTYKVVFNPYSKRKTPNYSPNRYADFERLTVMQEFIIKCLALPTEKEETPQNNSKKLLYEKGKFS